MRSWSMPVRRSARTEAASTITALVDAAENAIDELEQAAFLVSLLPVELEPIPPTPLGELSAAAISGAEAAVRGLEAAASLAEGDGGAPTARTRCKRPPVSSISSTTPTNPSAPSRGLCLAARGARDGDPSRSSLPAHSSGRATGSRLSVICCTPMSWANCRNS